MSVIDFSQAMSRLKHELRVSKDVEVGELLGLSQRAMSDRKKRGSFPERELVALSKRRPDLPIDISYVLTGKSRIEEAQRFVAVQDQLAVGRVRRQLEAAGVRSNEADANAAKYVAAAQPEQVLDDSYVRVPKHAVAASAGHGALVHDESIVDHLAFRREWLCKHLGVDPAHVALIDARGDSMSPTIESGDLLLLDTRAAEHRAEGIYVITLDGALLVKRIKFKLSGAVEVASDNPRYPPESLTRKAAAELAIVGRVVWHGRKV